MAGVLAASQLSAGMAYAAPEEDIFEARSEEKYEVEFVKENEEIEVNEASLDAEKEDAENVEISADDLIPPIEVAWDRPGYIKFKIASDTSMFYFGEIYINGNRGPQWYWGDLSTKYSDTEVIEYVGQGFIKSATYSFRIGVCEDDSKKGPIKYSDRAPDLEWTEPEEKVSTPTNLHWEKIDDNQFAVAVCDPVDHAYLHAIQLYEDGIYIPGGKTIAGTNGCKRDYSGLIGDLSEHEYTFDVRVYSDDLTQYANSLISERSPLFTMDEIIINTQKDILDLGKDVNAGNIDKTVSDVKSIENDTLKAALQTNNDAVEAMAKIENEYTTVKGIEILPATSDVAKIQADKVKITGAALNVSEGTVQLNIRDQIAEGSSLINTNIYTNIIAFDMSVNSSEGIDFTKELEVPVTISLPIPDGMSPNRMVVLHYRADGTEEIIEPRTENGKAIIAITHFSTFAFAEKKDASSDSGLGNTFSKEDAIKGVKAIDENHTLKLDVNAEGNFAGAKITDANGNVDENADSYLANIVTEYESDGTTPKTFYTLVFKDGKWDSSYDSAKDGAYVYNGVEYFVAGGVVNQNANGLTYTGEKTGFKFLAAGHVVIDNEGLVMYNGDWFWIDNKGTIDTGYAAIVDWNNAKFLVHGGKLRTDYTGFTYDPKNTTAWYHITAGQVWGDGEITDISIEGGEIARTCVNGVVQ